MLPDAMVFPYSFGSGIRYSNPHQRPRPLLISLPTGTSLWFYFVLWIITQTSFFASGWFNRSSSITVYQTVATAGYSGAVTTSCYCHPGVRMNRDQIEATTFFVNLSLPLCGPLKIANYWNFSSSVS